MLCNAVNFLAEECESTVVLCTATQPLLNKVEPRFGALSYSAVNEIIKDTDALFSIFKRVSIINMRRHDGYTYDEIADMAISEQKLCGSCLVVLNTTKTARDVFLSVKNKFSGIVLHLSANMCAAHRALIFDKIKDCLLPDKHKDIICISTQVIEAGVDVDFGSVIRSFAGLDSIAQAAGRCNRHGLREYGRVLLVNIKPELENIDMLNDIKIGREVTYRLLKEENADTEETSIDLFTPEMIERYFNYYFYNRKSEMVYWIDKSHNNNLLKILSTNDISIHEYKAYNNNIPAYPLRQSFESAAQKFRAIDSMTQGIIVPYDEGKQIISELCGEYNIHKLSIFLHKAQKYSVNVYNNKFEKLVKENVIYSINDKACDNAAIIWALREEFYSDDFGLCTERISKLKPEVR